MCHIYVEIILLVNSRGVINRSEYTMFCKGRTPPLKF